MTDCTFSRKVRSHTFLRELAHYEGMNVLKDYFGLPYTEDKPCEVRVIVYAPTKRKYDPPNWSPTTKALLDGLTDAEIWTDDNFNIIKRVSFEHGGLSGSKNYKIELNVHEVTRT